MWRACPTCGLEHPKEVRGCPLKRLVAQSGKSGLEAVPVQFRDPVLLHSQLQSRAPHDPA
jgi:hypothetical protein